MFHLFYGFIMSTPLTMVEIQATSHMELVGGVTDSVNLLLMIYTFICYEKEILKLFLLSCFQCTIIIILALLLGGIAMHITNKSILYNYSFTQKSHYNIRQVVDIIVK